MTAPSSKQNCECQCSRYYAEPTARHGATITRLDEKPVGPALAGAMVQTIARHVHRLVLGEIVNPRNASTAWLSHRISSSSNLPTHAATLVFGTVEILSTIKWHAARRALRSFGCTGRRNNGASILLVVNMQFYRIGRVEAVILNDDGGERFAHVIFAAQNGPDVASPHSSPHTVAASMNAQFSRA